MFYKIYWYWVKFCINLVNTGLFYKSGLFFYKTLDLLDQFVPTYTDCKYINCDEQRKYTIGIRENIQSQKLSTKNSNL